MTREEKDILLYGYFRELIQTRNGYELKLKHSKHCIGLYFEGILCGIFKTKEDALKWYCCADEYRLKQKTKHLSIK